MSWKKIACVAALGALAAPALAAPTISIVKNSNTTGSVFVSKTATSNTSLAAEIALTLSGATLTGVTLDSAWTANPGDDPAIAGSPTGGDVNGFNTFPGNVSTLTPTRVFASFGSLNTFAAAGTFKLFDFTYTGSGTATATGLVAGRNDANTANVVFGSLTSGPVSIGGNLPGDANADGTVNLLDLSILGANFGQSPRTFAQGNFNAPTDTVVNLLDLSILGANFGASGASAVSIPEPTSFAALSMGLVALAVRRRV